MSEEPLDRQENYYGGRSKPSEYLPYGLVMAVGVGILRMIFSNITSQKPDLPPAIISYTDPSPAISISSDSSSKQETDSYRTLLEQGNLSYNA